MCCAIRKGTNAPERTGEGELANTLSREADPGLAPTLRSPAFNLGFLTLKSLRFEGCIGIWVEKEKAQRKKGAESPSP